MYFDFHLASGDGFHKVSLCIASHLWAWWSWICLLLSVLLTLTLEVATDSQGEHLHWLPMNVVGSGSFVIVFAMRFWKRNAALFVFY